METLANPPQISPKLPSQPPPEPINQPNPSDRRKSRVSRLGFSPEAPRSRRPSKTLDVSDFAPEEFLARTRSAACDVSACDASTASVLRSWAAAFVRENGVVVGSIAELVDVEAPKGPEITDGMSPRKKKSVAELISAPDTAPVLPSRKRKQKGVGSVDLASLEVGSGVSEEGIGSPRRERKKSKYLSPPYTFDAEGSHSLKEEETEASERIADGKMSALRKYSGISGDVILAQLLLAASEPLNPKSNRPGKAIWGFFAEFRRFLISGDSEFENYLKSLDFLGGFDGKIVSGEFVDEVKEAKIVSNVDSGLSLGNELKKRGRPKKDRSVGENSTNLGDVGNGASVVVDFGSDLGKSVKRRKESKGLANGGASLDFGQNNIHVSELGERGQKRKSSGVGSNGGRVGKTRQTPRKKEGNVATSSSGPIHQLSYIRENLEMMILSLTATPSGIVPADCLKPEVKEDLLCDMQGLLNKVKKFQT